MCYLLWFTNCAFNRLVPYSCRERPRAVGRGGELREFALQHHAARDHGPGAARPLLPERIQSANLHVSNFAKLFGAAPLISQHSDLQTYGLKVQLIS